MRHAQVDRESLGSAISVAAELEGSAPQNLRLCEARGLLSPARSDGGSRRYSDEDITRIREIGRLLDAGLNLAGVAMIMTLQAANHALQAELEAATRTQVGPTHSTPPVAATTNGRQSGGTLKKAPEAPGRRRHRRRADPGGAGGDAP